MYENCSKVVKSFILYQNPFYAFSFPISLFIGIIVYGICVHMKCTSNSYLSQIIIPILTIILVNLLIEVISNMMLNNNEIQKLTYICINYLNKSEHFENEEENQQKKVEVINDDIKILNQNQNQSNDKDIVSPLNIVDNLYNSTFEVINKDNTPYTTLFNGLNSENNCKIA